MARDVAVDVTKLDQPLPGDARETVRALADRRVLGGVSLGRLYPASPELHRGLLVAATETTTNDDIEAFAQALGEVLTGAAP